MEPWIANTAGLFGIAVGAVALVLNVLLIRLALGQLKNSRIEEQRLHSEARVAQIQARRLESHR